MPLYQEPQSFKLSNCNYNAGAERMCDAVKDMTGQTPWILYKLCWRWFTPLICLVSYKLLTGVLQRTDTE